MAPMNSNEVNEENTLLIAIEDVDENVINKEIEELIGNEKYENFSDDFLKDYFREIGSYKLYTREEEIKVMEKAKAGDEKAKADFISHNLRLVVYVAKKYIKSTKSLSLEDLIMEGNIGLMKAYEKYDLSKGYKFSTYAIWWIKQNIVRAIYDTDSAIRIPVHLQEKYYKFIKFLGEKQESENKKYSHREIYMLADEYSKTNNLSAEKIIEVYNLHMISSLNMKIKADEKEESELENFVADDKSVETEVLNEYFGDELLSIAREKLSEREFYVLCQRFGFNENASTYTLEAIGDKMNITRERVRQIEVSAIKKLRHPKTKRRLEDCMMAI